MNTTRKPKQLIERTGHGRNTYLLSLTLKQTERIAEETAILDVLPKKQRAFLEPYFRDPAYHVAVNRLNKKAPAVLLVSLNAANDARASAFDDRCALHLHHRLRNSRL